LGIDLKLEGYVFERCRGRGRGEIVIYGFKVADVFWIQGWGFGKGGIGRMPYNRLYQNSSSSRPLTLYNRGLQRSLHLAHIIAMNSFCPMNLFDHTVSEN
jgi:hypothetical protein